jgi:hypothetical protein
MVNNQRVDKSKKVKNITAVAYLLIMFFLVGGSYLHQQSGILDNAKNKAEQVVHPQP